MKNAYVLSYTVTLILFLPLIAMSTLITEISQELNNTWDDHHSARNACFKWMR